MTRWVVIFDDTPAMLSHRKKNGAEHVAYVRANKDKILIGGGLMAVPDAPFEGGLWIVEADTHAEVIDLVVRDPYYLPQARRFKVFHWGRVLPEPVML